MSNVIIGVDGGGTHTTLCAVLPDGTPVAAVRGDSLNYYNIGMDAARAHLKTAVDALLAAARADDYDALSIGVSALDRTADAALIERFCGDVFDSRRTRMESDVFMGLFGMTLGDPGVMVVCGTGSFIVLLDEYGTQHAAGGWGHLVGDEGSAYALARAAIMAAIDAWEGGGPATALCDAVLAHFRSAVPRDVVDHLYEPLISPRDMAAFAPCVTRAAREDDAVARGILASHMRHLARVAACLMRGHPGVTRVGLWGGVMEHEPAARELFTQALLRDIPDARCGLLARSPALGAVALELKRRGLLTAQAVERLSVSIEIQHTIQS